MSPPFELLAEEVCVSLIQVVSVRGHGKSSSLRTIISEIQVERPDIVFKIFDVSQSHFHTSPLQHRQLVTPQTLKNKKVANLENCVYEMGQLSEPMRRAFVASIIDQDYRQRYNAKLNGTLDKYPFMVMIFEEANVYFGSYSFRKNDEYSRVLQDFASVGRNYRMSGFLVATAEFGEIAPSLRRRVSRLYGRVESPSDIQALRRKDKKAAETIKKIPRYHFLYFNGQSHGPFRVRDTVRSTPQDYYALPPPPAYDRPLGLSWWQQFFIGFAFTIVVMFVFFRM